MTQWTAEWPTEEGWYWFYGKRFGSSSTKMLQPVEVILAGRGDTSHLVYINSGNFMYKQEGARGLWMPLAPPPVPEEEEQHAE